MKVNIANLPTRLSLSSKHHHNGVQIKEIKVFFDQRPRYRVTTKYAGAWLLMDRDTQADDNAEHLYRYIRKNHPEQKIYFVLRKESHDWQRLEHDDFSLAFGESEHEAALKSCDKVISSHADKYVSNYLGLKNARWLYYFILQHGNQG